MTKTELLAALKPWVTKSLNFAIEAKGVKESYLVLNPLDAYKAIQMSFSDSLRYKADFNPGITFITVVAV